ncbi:MAG TPA: hypothetical protein VIV01_07370 [Hyphomicrobiaceae bacterium]|jgi:hypothetical protein
MATLVCSHPPGQNVKKSGGVVEYLSRIVDAKGSRASRLPKRYGLADNFRLDVLHQSELRDRLGPTAPLAFALGIAPMRAAA